MRWLIQALLGLVLSLGLASNVLAADPAGSTPASAIPLAPSASGSIVGSAAGSFAYFAFPYYGTGDTGTVAAEIVATDARMVGAFGVVLYQNGVKLGEMSGFGERPGVNRLPFGSTAAGPVLVQVYNYAPGVRVDFTLTLSGVKPPAEVPAPTPTPIPPAGSPANPVAARSPLGGKLEGNVAGSYVYYTLDYPGDESVRSVTLDFAPVGRDISGAVTLALFQNGVRLAADDGSHATTPGHLTLSFSSTTAGPVLVQIGNYNMWTTIDYTLR